MRAYCENCESFQPAGFRAALDLADSRPYEDLCCKACNYVIATVEDRPGITTTDATPPSTEDRWQPIATAPKDGTKFLAWRRHSTLPLIVHYDDEYSQWEDVDGILVYGLTHWMPLPKAPAMQGDKS